jgi:hypothetical protein
MVMSGELRVVRWLALTGVLLLAQGCDREVSAWQAAEASGETAGYEAYLRDHPEGEHAATAREQLDDLAWSRADAAGDRADLLAYLEAIPEGRHAADARAQIEDLDWTQAGAAHDAASYGSFADAHPESARAADARRLAAVVALDGDWFFGGYGFQIAPSAEGGPSVEPVLVESSPSDTWLILERAIANIDAADDALKFHHTVTTESRTGAGVVINNREIITVSQDEIRSEYDLRQVAPNRLEGLNREIYIGPGSTGYHDWDAMFLRATDPAAPSEGLYGRWVVGQTTPVVVRMRVDRDGAVALSSSPDVPRLLQGVPVDATYALETADGELLAFSEQVGPPRDTTTVNYACRLAAPDTLACEVRVTCSACTQTTIRTIAGMRLASDQ